MRENDIDIFFGKIENAFVQMNKRKLLLSREIYL